ncbi:MAG: SUMF1/EgtB/PvdO family nonheme iron enzyme [Candidatus Latescibacter sp.]|nr:SUMF1/EgtB/PvdO family nonheme iron enzyme [Candidatus Latescibacter sp.]
MKRLVKFSAVVFTIASLFCTTASSLTIQGTVTDAFKNPVSGASVVFTSEADLSRFWSATTDANGKYQIAITTSVQENDTSHLPQSFLLRQNYPNPFNPTTIIPFTLSKPGYCILAVYNIQGQKVRTLIDGYFSTGEHSVRWNGLDDGNRASSAGIYLYQLRVGGKSDTKKMLLLDGGVSDNYRSASSISKPEKSGKIVATTYRVTITGNDIVQYKENGLVISDTKTYDFTVIRINKYQDINFVSIPGGTFQMGDEVNDLSGITHPMHIVTVSGFEMSVYEITNAQYAKFLNEAKATGDITPSGTYVTGAKGAYSGCGYINLAGSRDANNKCWITYDNTTFSAASGKEKWPVVYVTWYGAKSFALYYGLDLPREAEWEYACRGGKQYLYGTDDGTINIMKANYYPDGPFCPKDVGSYPKNPFGLYDMSGNVFEFCNDWSAIYSAENVSNPQGPSLGFYRVHRGGGWGRQAKDCRSAFRGQIEPSVDDNCMGFRVVRR